MKEYNWGEILSRQRKELETYKENLQTKDKRIEILQGYNSKLEDTIKDQESMIRDLLALVGELRIEINGMQQNNPPKKPIKNNLSVVRFIPIKDKKAGESD